LSSALGQTLEHFAPELGEDEPSPRTLRAFRQIAALGGQDA
jgi:hypothetical protein